MPNPRPKHGRSVVAQVDRQLKRARMGRAKRETVIELLILSKHRTNPAGYLKLKGVSKHTLRECHISIEDLIKIGFNSSMLLKLGYPRWLALQAKK